MPIFKPPYSFNQRDLNLKSVFLAGSIEMDKAENWQKHCESELTNNYNVFNPRRNSWDSSWKQEIENKQFKEQVEWELKALEEADIIIMYFASETKSPISLLEFGLYATSKKMIVVCAKDFWRKGNVDIVCERYNIEQHEHLNQVIDKLKTT